LCLVVVVFVSGCVCLRVLLCDMCDEVFSLPGDGWINCLMLSRRQRIDGSPKAVQSSHFLSICTCVACILLGQLAIKYSHCYMAPEMSLGLGSDITADVYSFGVVLWELTSLQKPVEQFKTKKFRKANRVNYSFRPSVTCIPSPGLRKLIKDCWAFRSTDRPDFRHILRVLEVVPMEVYDRAGSSGSIMSDDSDHTSQDHRAMTASAHFNTKISSKELGMDGNDGSNNEEFNMSAKSDTAFGVSYMTGSPVARASSHARFGTSTTNDKWNKKKMKKKSRSGSFDIQDLVEPRDKDSSSAVLKSGDGDEVVPLDGTAQPTNSLRSSSGDAGGGGLFKKPRDMFRTWSLSSGRSEQGDESDSGEPKERRKSGVFTRGVFRTFSSSSSKDDGPGKKKRPMRRHSRQKSKDAAELSTGQNEYVLQNDGNGEDTKVAASKSVSDKATTPMYQLTHPTAASLSPKTSTKTSVAALASNPMSKAKGLERQLEDTTDAIVSLQAEKNVLAARIESIDASLISLTQKNQQEKKKDFFDALTEEREMLALRLEKVEEDISDKAVKLLDIQDDMESA
jgi:hypothetical protein